MNLYTIHQKKLQKTRKKTAKKQQKARKYWRFGGRCFVGVPWVYGCTIGCKCYGCWLWWVLPYLKHLFEVIKHFFKQ